MEVLDSLTGGHVMRWAERLCHVIVYSVRNVTVR